MPKVWLLEFYVPYDGNDVIGVYSTYSAAIAARSVEIETRGLTKSFERYLTITSWTVDGPADWNKESDG